MKFLVVILFFISVQLVTSILNNPPKHVGNPEPAVIIHPDKVTNELENPKIALDDINVTVDQKDNKNPEDIQHHRVQRWVCNNWTGDFLCAGWPGAWRCHCGSFCSGGKCTCKRC
uniref:Uncharacterized protein n=1 Tax=Panagrolaimus davidi TaxID=227884 RepID=A0A914QWZ4_9BILA